MSARYIVSACLHSRYLNKGLVTYMFSCQIVRFELLYTRSMEKPRESQEMKELKAFLEDAPEELKNLQVALNPARAATRFVQFEKLFRGTFIMVHRSR